MRKNDLEFAVPSTDYELSAQEVENLNDFFAKTDIGRKSNPITFTRKEYDNVPKKAWNLKIPKSVLFFRSGFYNSKGHTLKSQSGIFASQAILYGIKADADLAEKGLMEMKRKHYSVVYRKGNIVGSTNMYRPGKTTKEYRKLVKFIELSGFKITKIPPK